MDNHDHDWDIPMAKATKNHCPSTLKRPSRKEALALPPPMKS